MSHWVSKDISAAYAACRPLYPSSLYEYIAQHAGVKRFDLCVDVGCGTGQASGALAAIFKDVLACDISESQVAAAVPVKGVRFAVAGGEDFAKHVAPHSADMVAVAQAVHWFDTMAFAANCDAALRPGGVVGLWTYQTLSAAHAGVSAAVAELDASLMASGHWPPQRRHVDDAYADIRRAMAGCGWATTAAVDFEYRAVVTMDHLLNYLGTWSGVHRAASAKGETVASVTASVLNAAPGATEPEKRAFTTEITFPIKTFFLKRHSEQ